CRGCVRCIHIADEGPLGVVEVPPTRMNSATRLVGLFLFPLADDEEIGLDLQQLLEDQREALCGWLLQGENLRIEIVHAKKPTMAFEVGFAEVVVEKSILLECCELQLLRRKIQDLLQNSKGLLPA